MFPVHELFLTAVLLAATPAVPPEALAMPGASQPFWVSASAAVGTDGAVRESLVDPDTRRILLAAKAAPREKIAVTAAAAPCDTITIRPYHGTTGKEYRSLDALQRNAAAVYVTRVTSVAPGFANGMPATLLTAEISDTLRTGAAFPESGDVYLQWQGVDFDVFGTRFCNRSPVTAYTPKAGDLLIVFAYDQPRDSTRRFLYTAPEHLIAVRDGVLYGADDLSDHQALRNLTLEALLDGVRAGTSL